MTVINSKNIPCLMLAKLYYFVPKIPNPAFVFSITSKFCGVQDLRFYKILTQTRIDGSCLVAWYVGSLLLFGGGFNFSLVD